MSKQLRLDVAQLTDVGRRRPHNEDNMAYVMPKDEEVMTRKGALFVVADGMGGHAAGEVASEIAVDTISNVYYQQDDNEDVPVSLLQAIKRANTLIHQRAAENMSRSGMGTTCVTAVFRGGTAFIANVGDSRAYLVRGGQVKQVSQDHSWVEEQVRAGLLTRDQAKSHAQRNVITRCLGTQADVEVDVFTEKLEEGDTLILCSDGLSGQVSDDDLRSIIGKYKPQESVYRLIERANENGGPDNITVIVINVLEPGWDPYPVSVGGREISNVETAILARTPSSALTASSKIDEALTQPIPPARLSGPLTPQEAPRPALTPARPKRRRLLLPTISILVLLLIALLAGGSYFYLLPVLFPSANTDHALADAASQITFAKKDNTSGNPGDALKALASAQKDLRSVQHATLSDAQKQSFKSAQNDFVLTTQSAITTYNQQALIVSLPCSGTASAAVNNGATNTQPVMVAAVNDNANKLFRYALGADHNLYQLDDHNSLVDKQNLAGNPQVSLIASADQHLLTLTSTMAKNNMLVYSLDVLSPKSGNNPGVMTDILNTYTKDGMVPKLLTAWGADVYLVLMSPTAPNSATILDFPLDNGKLGNPHPLSISISTAIVSIAAFPDHQLFLLNGDGNIQSLQFGANGQASSVVSQHPVPTPLGTSAKDFTLSTDVPVPGQQSSFLALPDVTHAAFLTAGMVGNEPHLYVVDGFYHRVIALQVAQNSTTSKSPTPVATQNSNSKTGGGVASQTQPLNMALVQQYVSSDLFNTVRGVATDPKSPILYLLASNGQSTAANLVSVGVDPQANSCTP